MKKVLIIFVSVFAIFTLNAQNPKKTLLTIEGEKVTVGEFLNVYQKNNVNNEVIDKKSLEEYLDLYINFRLKVKEAEDLGLDTVASLQRELDGYRKQLAQPYFVDKEVTKELVREAYDRKLIDIRASHILIKCDETATVEDTIAAYNKALEVKDKLLNGGDFTALAIEYSDDPSARDMPGIPNVRPPRKGNGGDLGYFTVFDMLYPFESAAYNTPEGEYSEIIRTQYGYHILNITDRKEAMGFAQVAHLYMRMPEGATAEDSLKVKDRIYKVSEEIKNGGKFESLVRKYSDDKGSAEKGGVLPKFGVNRMVPEFIKTISDMEGEGSISDPIMTDYGWHIVKLITIDKPGTFEDEKKMIEDRIIKDSRSYKSKQSVIDKVKKEYKFKEFPEAKEQFMASVDSSIVKGGFKADTFKTQQTAVFRLGKTDFTQYEFAQFLEEKVKGRRKESMEVILSDKYKEFVDQSCMDYLDAHLEEKYDDFRAIMKEYRDGILLFELTDRKVWTKAIEDTTGLKTYYEDNKSEYMWGDRIDATIFTVNEKELADSVISMVKDGMEIAVITNKFNLDGKTMVVAEKSKFSKGDNPYIDQVKWEKGISEKIPSEIDNSVRFVVVNELLAPQPKELKEARGIITADYQAYLEKAWIKELRNKYSVEINQKVLDKIQ